MFTGPDHSPDAAICSRIESDKPVGTKGAGWLHRLRDDDQWRRAPRARRVKIDTPTRDFGEMVAECEAACGPLNRGVLATDLGVTCESLSRMRLGWSHQHRAYVFPMTDATGMVRGARLRATDGRKWSVTGGREGLFIPTGLPNDASLLLIVEGASDVAAMLDLGFAVIGRPSCSGGRSLCLGYVLRDAAFTPRTVAIIADRDEAGERGAWKLATSLVTYVPSVRIICPPAGVKDARQWKREGATRDDVIAAINEAPSLEINYSGRVVA